jgi:hypothetical protein
VLLLLLSWCGWNSRHVSSLLASLLCCCFILIYSLRKELVATKKQVQDLDQRRSSAEAQLANLRSAYDRLSADAGQCQAQLSAATKTTAAAASATAAAPVGVVTTDTAHIAQVTASL